MWCPFCSLPARNEWRTWFESGIDISSEKLPIKKHYWKQEPHTLPNCPSHASKILRNYLRLNKMKTGQTSCSVWYQCDLCDPGYHGLDDNQWGTRCNLLVRFAHEKQPESVWVYWVDNCVVVSIRLLLIFRYCTISGTRHYSKDSIGSETWLSKLSRKKV